MASEKVAVVTGAARPWGLGRTSAMMLAKKGYDIAVVDVRDDWGNEAVQAIKAVEANALYVKTDLTKKADIEAMVDKVTAEFGRIDVLCNIAGISPRERLDDIKEETFDAIINVNVRGPLFAIQAVAPVMRKQGGGRIVNVSSGSSLQPLKGLAVYSASKAGITMMAKVLAWELSRDNIAITNIAPGSMPTAMGQETGPNQDDYERGSRGQPFMRGPTTEEVADVLVYAATTESTALTGQTLHANGGAFMVS
jgi:NAD(P)-dependent dehydrogenase (short-subunit alcohol dehydrogenase family)